MANATPSRAKSHGFADWLVEEIWWFVRASVWSLVGAAIAAYPFLFRLGPRFLEDSDAPARSYTWGEYVVAPFLTMLNPFGFAILLGCALVALLPARLFIRHRHLARSTVCSALCVAAYVLIPRFPSFLGWDIWIVLSAALFACRLWPGRFFALEREC